MSDQMLTKVIDELSKRLGTAYDITASAIEQYTQLRAMQSIYAVVVLGVLLIISLVVIALLIYAYRHADFYQEENLFTAAVIAGFVTIGVLIVFLIFANSTLGWCLHPQGMLVQEIIQAVK